MEFDEILTRFVCAHLRGAQGCRYITDDVFNHLVTVADRIVEKSKKKKSADEQK